MRRTLSNSVKYVSYCALWILVGSMLAINVLADELPLPPAGKAPTVQAVEMERPASPMFRVSTDAPAPAPNHPPIDQIPPMPMPAPREQRGTVPLKSPGTGIFHNPQTKETITGPMDISELTSGLPGGQGGGFAGVDGGGGSEPLTASFNTMSKRTDTASDPWRMNVKVVVRFGTSYAVCSGTMRDAGTVLTAGHCVYDFGGSGWADEAWVYPGWDGAFSQWGPPASTVNPYGYGSTVTNLGSWTNWTSSGDLDYDFGLIGFDRAVGQLTGWFGWTWGGDCAWHQGKTYNNASYPSQSCGTTGLHTGTDMYYWYGSVDSCPWNQLQLNTTAGCFTAVWGGMSGSGMYWMDGDTRRVHAICSTSDRSTWGRYARQTEAWVNWTDGTFIADTRGSAFDLQPLDMNLAPTTITAGNATTTLNHLATNATNNNPVNAAYSLGVYLSSNDNISTGDTWLSDQGYTWDFSAMGSVTINMGQVTIPPDTPAGDYWIGVVYPTATDGDSANNNTEGWDAAPIHVNARTCTAPSTVTASDAASTSSVTITWNDSTSCDYYYRVYRNTTNNSGTATALGSWQTSQSYTDTTAVAGQPYYYWVKSGTNTSGMYASAFSSSNSGWRDLQLTDNTPVTGSTIPTNYSFTVYYNDWAGVAINPAPNDHDVLADDNADFSSYYQDSTSIGTYRDFVVFNGHTLGTDTRHYANVHYGSSSAYTIEAEYSIPDLTVGSPASNSMGSTEVIDLFEIPLTNGKEYQLTLDITSGTADLEVYVFSSSRTSGRRSVYDWMVNANGAGGDETLTFTANATGAFGIAVINANAASANYTLTVAEPQNYLLWTK